MSQMLKPEELNQRGYYQRWDVHQRVQHLLLMVSVIILMLTGFPIKYSNASWAAFLINLFGGFDSTFALHLTAAVIMLCTGGYHLIYLLVQLFRIGWKRARVAVSNMAPTPKDVRDAFQHALYLLGLHPERPKYGRYSYLEKFEYLAVFWGMIVMGGSGFFLWFPELGIQLFPRWVLDALRIVHSNEAFVALLSLAFGHLFFVHFHPDVFPTSPVWFNGKISLERLVEEHPLELEQLGLGHVRSEFEKRLGHGTSGLSSSRWSRSIPLVIIELVAYIAIFLALLIVFVPLIFV